MQALVTYQQIFEASAATLFSPCRLSGTIAVRIVEMGGGWAPLVVQLVHGLRAAVAMGSVVGMVMEPLVQTLGAQVVLMAEQRGGVCWR